MAVDLRDERIDHTDGQYQKMLANLQGNILKGHGRDHSVHLLLKFTATPPMVRSWVRAFTDGYVISAAEQLKEVEQFNKYRLPGGLFGNFFLTAKGYEALDYKYTEYEISRRFEDQPAGIDRQEVAIKFCHGMASSREELNDPDPAEWEEAYLGRQIHAMILLADDDVGFLLRQAKEVFENVSTVADVLAIEHGRVMRNDADESIEHFGYVDGRSQPLFLKADIESEAEKFGIDVWDPSAPLALALVPAPIAGEEDCFGSYFVFRKLEQNVWGFKTREEGLASALGLTEKEAERAGALVIGRFEDGTPVTLSPKEKMAKHVPNNFDYHHDRNASLCPLHAHIRKVNPRGDTGNLEEERQHRVVRRGITYGRRSVEPKDDPTLGQMPSKGVGLLFMCFQSSLANQFGFLQKIYANSLIGTGIDPVIGQRKLDAPPEEQHWPREWYYGGVTDFHFGDFVKLKGGEFFFAPSIHFFKSLCVKAPV